MPVMLVDSRWQCLKRIKKHILHENQNAVEIPRSSTYQISFAVSLYVKYSMKP
jgi:hypothetical protein